MSTIENASGLTQECTDASSKYSVHHYKMMAGYKSHMSGFGKANAGEENLECSAFRNEPTAPRANTSVVLIAETCHLQTDKARLDPLHLTCILSRRWMIYSKLFLGFREAHLGYPVACVGWADVHLALDP